MAKLLLREEGSDEVAALWQAAGRIMSSRLLYVEARAALARAIRNGRVGKKGAISLRQRLELRVDEVDLVELTPQVATIAGDCAEAYGLRANDSIHLAAALTQDRTALVLASWDAELRRAATQAGFAIAPG